MLRRVILPTKPKKKEKNGPTVPSVPKGFFVDDGERGMDMGEVQVQ